MNELNVRIKEYLISTYGRKFNVWNQIYLTLHVALNTHTSNQYWAEEH